MYEATYSGSEESDQWATPDNKGIYTPHIKNHLDKNLEDSNEIGYVYTPSLANDFSNHNILGTTILEVGAISQVYFQLSHIRVC